ncbi:MAG: GumN protein [Nitrospirales bacterium]|nr:MAG: GumN protein [Nitrospirales bacterium]
MTSDQNTIYLLGSVHVLKQENYPLHDTINQAFESASHLVFEVNLDEISSPLTQKRSLTKGLYTDGRTLRDALSPGNFAFTKSKLKNRGYSIEMFNRMKPWMLATTITILELQKLGFGTDHGVDQHFFQRAKAQGKTVEGLETVEYQLNLFDSLSPKTQEQFLLQTLDEINILEQQTHQLVNSWTHGQIEGLEVMLENMKKFPEVYEALITRRNNSWLPHFESYLQKHETAMIVVGTLHLLGKQGLLAMLQEKGYVIKQL